MVSSRAFSTIERKPRAPVLRSMAFLAMASSASCVKVISAPSMSNKYLYCLTKAFFGSVRICTKASSSSSCSAASTGKRPISSGIRPNLIKSSGSTCCSKSELRRLSSFELTSALKPIPPFSVRCWMTLSSPANAPPTMIKMLLVSTWISSCCGCLRPP